LIKKGKTEEILLEPDLHLFCPEYIFEEFDKYKGEILMKTKRADKEYDDVCNIIKAKIKTIPNEETEKYMVEASLISPDKKDVDYSALALKMKCGVWSNDKLIKDK
jgi:predicted nucleic acid-binding protein